MPIYEYKCENCGKVFDYKQSFSDEPLTKCPPEVCENASKGCGSVRRIISKNIGLVFNGKGFYLTDYANKKTSVAKSSTSSDTSAPSSAPESAPAKAAV